METLRITEANKDQAIKEINKFRLSNKNKWFQVELKYLPYVYKIKAYNTWVQIIRKESAYSDHVEWSDSGCMDISVKQFKDQLFKWIE